MPVQTNARPSSTRFEPSSPKSEAQTRREPMRQQVNDRTGQAVKEHLMDGGFLLGRDRYCRERRRDIGGSTTRLRARRSPPIPRDQEKLDQRYIPKPTDTEAQAAWRQCMGTEQTKGVLQGSSGNDRNGQRGSQNPPRAWPAAWWRHGENRMRGARAQHLLTTCCTSAAHLSNNSAFRATESGYRVLKMARVQLTIFEM